MFDVKKYKFGFNLWGLILFLLIMIPNFIWFAIPAGNDILRNESVTPVIDTIASIFQVIMVCALCVIINKQCQKTRNKVFLLGITVAIALYYLCWCMYYMEIIHPIIILALCIAPCIAFILYSIMKKNAAALISAVIFMVCHVIYGFANFIN